jgi:hypothetical protein
MRVKKDMHVKSDTQITNDTRVTIDCMQCETHFEGRQDIQYPRIVSASRA